MAVEVSNNFLAVDIGGTKTEVALFHEHEDLLKPLLKQRYASREADSIEEILADFIDAHRISCERISLGIAGVVNHQEANVTNLPWRISRANLSKLGFSAISMINDMTAVASSLRHLSGADLFTLQHGPPKEAGIKAILAPGTGLGEGFLLEEEPYWYPRGTEGGHCDFAPIGKQQYELLQWLAASEKKAVTYEMVCAGPGISILYDFFRFKGVVCNPEVAAKLDRCDDRTPGIVESALAGSCSACSNAVELFLTILGREAANLVMKVYATGGLFLGGGILPRLVGSFSLVPFLKAFHAPGPMASIMAAIPIHVILRRDAALIGTASYGKRVLFR